MMRYHRQTQSARQTASTGTPGLPKKSATVASRPFREMKGRLRQDGSRRTDCTYSRLSLSQPAKGEG